MEYSVVKVGLIPKAKLKKSLKTGKLSLTKDELKGNRHLVLHPMNASKVINAQKNDKGVQGLMLTKDEVKADLDYHASRGASLSGGSFWSDLWGGVKKAANFVKDSGIGSILADAAVPFASTVLGPAGATVARQVVRNVTGVGLRGKKTRKRLTGSSFMIN